MSSRAAREKKSRIDALAELKRAREGGGRTIKLEEDAIYDEVDEAQYKTIVKGRLERDDFVVDDGDGEYVDDGREDWSDGDRDKYESEEEPRKKSKKSKAEVKPKAKPKPKPEPAPTMSAYRPAVSAKQEDDFMANLLGDMDAAPVTVPPKKSRKRRSPPVDTFDASSPPRADYSFSRVPVYDDASSDAPIESDVGFDAAPSSDDELMSPRKKRVKGESGMDVTHHVQKMSELKMQGSSDVEFDDLDMNEFMAVDDDEDLKPAPPIKKEPTRNNFVTYQKKPAIAVKKEEEDVKPAWLNVYDSLTVAEGPDSLGPLSPSTQGASSSSKINALEPDGSLRFFWLDYLELDGKIYFIGKLRDKKTGVWVSCCVTVENIERNLFVLPRPKRVEPDEDGSLHETDEVPTLQEVYGDFDEIRKAHSIKTFKAKFVKRKYAFDIQDVPRKETQWLKVVYPFTEPQVVAGAHSPCIAHIFGTNTSAFELLVLKRKIMGPCWLVVKNPKIESQGISWCKLEAIVSDPKDINPFPETDHDAPKDTPPLTVMSLSVRTIVNHKENNREVVCATARIWHNMVIDDPTPPEKLPCTVNTYVRPLESFPPKFAVKARSNVKGFISPMPNERELLSNLLSTIFKADPDVIVGHDFLGVSLDVLLHRMKNLKVEHWSRISRFRRSKWPSIGRQGTNLRFLNGRMLCDLASDGAKSMIASTTWSLTEMCKTHLKYDRQDIDPDDTANYFDGSVSTPDKLLSFVRHCEMDAHYQMAIAHKLQILALTKQLTNLAGNSWNKTLNGGRAERNEYILLHEFHRLKYICPDKTYGKVTKQVEEEDQEGGGGTTSKKGKRDKYKGGLVFEPKRGLWDKYILVMDFNSLYPSIIQEFNIDFTTIERSEEVDEDGEEKIPDPPERGKIPPGVLPRLISTLVQRRRQVKSLMKEKGISPGKILQYDIKQQALKLTANSMYGCLGFEHSRFYARHLAALTTFKGRETLTRTRELAEKLQLEVIYGDTDSVFVNSGVTDLEQALTISTEFKLAVNKQYKELEIDLDGVFQRLLLLQKKKYAALKVEEGNKTRTEVKGLDMKRREYCALSKNVSQYVLEQILSGDPTEVVVENIHEYLRSLNQNVREGKTPLEEFIIYKRLGKKPEDYPDAKSQPHVQVALRMKSKGQSAKAGDVISYIFCIAEGEQAAKTAQAERAKHPDEVRRGGADVKIDYEFYLSQQVLPPIERLCDPIEGTDRVRLAECLGLDPARYRNVVGDGEERLFSSLDSRMTDKERFKDATPFFVRCRSCGGEMDYVPSTVLLPAGPTCPACNSKLETPSLLAQLEVQIRRHISKYYEGWTVCDDPTCGTRTRMMRVYGRRCLRPSCRGQVRFEYTDGELYTQLQFYSSLFNQVKLETAMDPNIVKQNLDFLKEMTKHVEKHLNQCGRRWVEMGSIFSFMKI
ncbi:hypothetical protein AX16_003272 [Volvariella volvacea WC 439]|nr:hypothetical protein AX16_003272 [Volvariella volvacea WC 439]